MTEIFYVGTIQLARHFVRHVEHTVVDGNFDPNLSKQKEVFIANLFQLK